MLQGDRMVWQALKVACEANLDGDSALAGGILEASGITMEAGTLVRYFNKNYVNIFL